MFSFKRASGKAVLIADVDDTSVGVALVRLASSGSATVLASERKNLTLEERTGEQKLASIAQLLEETMNAPLTKYETVDSELTHSNAPPKEVIVVVRAPWTQFRTVQTEEVFSESKVITRDLLSTIAKKALSAESPLDRANIIESGVLQVFVNGYATGNPVGKKGTRVSVVAFEADMNAEAKRVLMGVIQKRLPGRNVRFKSSMRGIFMVLHEHIPDVHRYVIIDIGGSTTTCAVIRREAISQIASVPEGRATLITRVSGAGLPEETLTQLRMLAADTCATDACKALKDSLARTEPDLTKVYGEVFTSLAAVRRLPNAAMLVAPAELSPWLQGLFSKIDFAQFTATMQPFQIETLSADHLRDVVQWDTGTPPDTHLSIAAGYVNILEQSGS